MTWAGTAAAAPISRSCARQSRDQRLRFRDDDYRARFAGMRRRQYADRVSTAVAGRLARSRRSGGFGRSPIFSEPARHVFAALRDDSDRGGRGAPGADHGDRHPRRDRGRPLDVTRGPPARRPEQRLAQRRRSGRSWAAAFYGLARLLAAAACSCTRSAAAVRVGPRIGRRGTSSASRWRRVALSLLLVWPVRLADLRRGRLPQRRLRHRGRRQALRGARRRLVRLGASSSARARADGILLSKSSSSSAGIPYACSLPREGAGAHFLGVVPRARRGSRASGSRSASRSAARCPRSGRAGRGRRAPGRRSPGRRRCRSSGPTARVIRAATGAGMASSTIANAAGVLKG